MPLIKFIKDSYIKKELNNDDYKKIFINVSLLIFVFILLVIFFHYLRNYWPKYLTFKVKNQFFIYYIFPLIGTIIFGFIDSLFFFIFEDDYLHFLTKFTNDIITSSLILGGLSSFVAIYFGRNMHILMEIITTCTLEPSPLQEGIGILIGTAIVLIGYIIYKRLIDQKKNKKINA